MEFPTCGVDACFFQEEIVQALDVSSQRIDTILRVFGRAIQSEGVQACHTLKVLGKFSLL